MVCVGSKDRRAECFSILRRGRSDADLGRAFQTIHLHITREDWSAGQRAGQVRLVASRNSFALLAFAPPLAVLF